MRKITLSFIALLHAGLALGQSTNNAYKFSEDILHKINNDSTSWKYQVGATELSFSGYYKQVLEIWDKNGARAPKYNKIDSSFFNNYSQLNARDYIIDRSKNEEIIFINEAHHIPQHRIFTKSLLQGLYDNGYRYLGLEALSDKDINQRKFPTIESGYYIQEPEFGNLVAEALKIGFVLFGYEATAGKNGKEREIEQARNIQKFIENAPKGKYIIHCGYAHAFESDYPAWEKALAGRIKEFMKIDPFTIDQTMFLEKSDEKNESKFIGLNTNNYPILLRNKDGNIYTGNKAVNQTDIVVIHPKTKYVNGRPDWSMQGKKKYTLAQHKISQTPLLVLAYRKGEFENNGVACEVVEITEQKVNRSLFLPKGNYKIVIKNKDYEVVDQFEIQIK